MVAVQRSLPIADRVTLFREKPVLNLQNGDLIDSEKRLREASSVFIELLKSLDLVNCLAIVSSCIPDARGYVELELVIKREKSGSGDKADPFGFRFQMNEQNGSSRIKYGFAKISPDGVIFEDNATANKDEFLQRPRTFLELKTKFESFLDLVRITLAKT